VITALLTLIAVGVLVVAAQTPAGAQTLRALRSALRRGGEATSNTCGEHPIIAIACFSALPIVIIAVYLAWGAIAEQRTFDHIIECAASHGERVTEQEVRKNDPLVRYAIEGIMCRLPSLR
jgi:hypothetical protein